MATVEELQRRREAKRGHHGAGGRAAPAGARPRSASPRGPAVDRLAVVHRLDPGARPRGALRIPLVLRAQPRGSADRSAPGSLLGGEPALPRIAATRAALSCPLSSCGCHSESVL